MSTKPIGVFDSGVGGLTVLEEIVRKLPNENVIYVGDTARVPYGPRGENTVRKFATELAEYLLKKDVKALVIACNTISWIALDKLKENLNTPIIDVVNPTVKKALERTKTRKIGVIGTTTTISSGYYEKRLKDEDANVGVFSIACPLFVSIVEEGLSKEEIAKVAAEHYLGGLRGKIDTLILGCTHFPLIEDAILKSLPGVQLIESSNPTVEELRQMLDSKGILNQSKEPGKHEILVTDLTDNVRELATKIFSEKTSIKEISL